jgi:hypothetical protein
MTFQRPIVIESDMSRWIFCCVVRVDEERETGDAARQFVVCRCE